MLKRTLWIGVVCFLLAALTGLAGAGAKIDGWVMDDFQSYSSTADLKATGFTSGGPWWILQELQASLGMLTIPPQTTLSIELVRDPNAFIASGEPVDPNHPAQAIKVHYKLSAEMSCDIFRFTSTMGIPFQWIETGQPAPLDILPVADFTKIDRLVIKFMNKTGNHTVRDDFLLSLVGPDAEPINYYKAQATQGKFLEYPEGVWIALEFDINGPTNPGPSAFGRNMVSAITLGTSDTPGTEVTYLIDDIMLYNKSVPCTTHSPADLNLDCAVDLEDLALLAAGWMCL